MTRKPKHFHLVYETGVRAEFCDPVTGKPWYRLKFGVIKTSMATLAKTSGDSLTLINNSTRNSITVAADGRWS